MEKDKGGRPTKLTDNLINAIDEVLKEKDVIVMNDEELVMFVNEKLPIEEQISYTSFMHWKTGYLPEIKTETDLIKRFLQTIKAAMYLERQNLMKELKRDSQWQRYAWILERKFKEWNLKQISEQDINLKTDIVWNEVKNYGTDDKTD
jgi:hypothetical protein